ncbi:DUF389 domain-containing protein [Natrialba chahannaoensis]|uniref:DUF389 domain-containing protein n=1 Tax=Natrialba chahannaoensis TaxID=68911 RepID=UPI000AD3D224
MTVSAIRYLEITVPRDCRQAVLAALGDEGIEYVIADEATASVIEDAAVVRFSLPTPAVEPVLDRLPDVGLDDVRVVVIDAQTVVSQEFDELREQYSCGGVRGERTSRQVLRTKADAFMGVMIAAALIPPAAAVGITTVWGMYGAALGAFVLVVITSFRLTSPHWSHSGLLNTGPRNRGGGCSKYSHLHGSLRARTNRSHRPADW